MTSAKWETCPLRQEIWALLALACFSTMAQADPVLPHLISDHAVFQQGHEIHLWGTADPGEKITVTLARNSATASANSAGRWDLHLSAMSAGGPFTLIVTGKKTLVIKDILIGEVWIASGQSNMTFALGDSAGASEEIPKADYPEIRLFTVPKRVTLSAQQDTLAEAWHLCTPEAVKEFSAVAYYFARELHRKLGVPIGIVESAWPGTAIEEWTAPLAAQQNPQIKTMLDQWDTHEGKGFSEGKQTVDMEFDDFELLPATGEDAKPLPFANFDAGNVHNALGGYWFYDWHDTPETSFELVFPGHGGGGFAAHVAGKVDASDDSRWIVRYHLDASPADLTAYAGIRFWVRGDGNIRFRSLQPTITDWDDYSLPPQRVAADWRPVTVWFRDLRQEGWGVRQDFTQQTLTGFVIESMPAAGYPARPATGLYRGMIAPLMPYDFRGVIWYQGESNALKAVQYRTLLPTLIDSWRAESQQTDMQFLIVQLPNYGAIPQQPADSAWARLREAELLTAQQHHGVGLAVTIDVGDPSDLHPHRKAAVGQRLALWALGTTYHQPIVYSGPLFKSMMVEGHSARLTFTNIGGGLIAKDGGALRGFAIAGADRRFHWASAQIDSDSILVSSSDVAAPIAVRYAWADSPECNLFNAEGLPASPFRTDDWPNSPGR